ncbi:Tab2/Atab2 family RNA-binding protein [Chroococcidiopsis sp. FACHB-1243]|uniref:Tab2/Atab2 family RNA-binding protein n=1 Tax=Chroococcidiopsis sp. [FACHB-1243] TaxID=2692781 RepID=UPI001783BFF2|nr:Tab2/Atab2 family RNA-binding protein [Chroococcidiopsis sp. [FACHB-1243]]MBD2308777.1 Tab2/Atab2 family RNA-binding protein [Chroococcidiopsis sp. [FACHB-1243]]
MTNDKSIWQADFYRRPWRDDNGEVLWELLICDAEGGMLFDHATQTRSDHRTGNFRYEAICPQAAANASWLVEQLQLAASQLPDIIQVFRPQSFSLIATAGQKLGITVEPTRRTGALKQWLRSRIPQYSTNGAYNPLAVDKPPPVPLPENLWGDRWRFASLPAGDLEAAFKDRPLPILDMPEFLLPLNLGLASTIAVPGVIIYGERKSMQLARWLQAAQPIALNYVPGELAGLVLEAGLADRWVVATFSDREAIASAQTYVQRQQQSQGLHFLLVQPDDSGMTYTGFWLLRDE